MSGHTEVYTMYTSLCSIEVDHSKSVKGSGSLDGHAHFK